MDEECFSYYIGECTQLVEFTNSFKSCLDNHCRNQHIIYNISVLQDAQLLLNKQQQIWCGVYIFQQVPIW